MSLFSLPLTAHSTWELRGARWGEVQAPRNCFFQSLQRSAHLRPSILPELFVLCLKLLPTPWAARPPSPWALPGWWFLWAGPCWWWPGTVSGRKPEGTPPSPRRA